MDYNSNYEGQEVQDILDSVKGKASQEDLNLAIERIDDLASEKQDDITDLDTIRAGAAKGATALQSVPSEYVTESELTAKNYATTSALNDKVDKVTGKGLSTEDFTSALKTKLEGLSNYDDTELSEALSTLRGDFDKLVSGDTTTAIKTFNEVIAFLDGIQDSQDLSGIITSIEQQIAGKYTKPSGGIPASDLAPDVFLQGEKGDKGDKGDTGATGPQGPQGVSVTSVAQTTTSSSDGGSNVVTVTLSDGKTSTFTVKNGSKGSQGDKGDKGDTGAAGANGTNGKDGADGKNGATFTPSVDANGNLSWTNNKGLSNPPTVNIKGPKGDSGEGGGSGEDIRYFTEFTVEDFIEACDINGIITKNTTELFNAMKSNKVICVPYRGYDKGFVVASYKIGEEVSDTYMYLQKDGAEYYANEGDNNSFIGMYPEYNFIQVVEVEAPTGFAQIDCMENRLYKITEPVDIIDTVISEVLKPSTIQFVSGNSGTTINCYDEVFWANGEMPPIEPNTWYELSVTSNINDAVFAVLTPFKPVE